jgi:hypothetical protein
MTQLAKLWSKGPPADYPRTACSICQRQSAGSGPNPIVGDPYVAIPNEAGELCLTLQALVDGLDRV